MKKSYFVYGAVLLIIVAVAVGWVIESKPFWSSPAVSSCGNVRAIQLDGKVICVEVADNDATRELGLSGHAPLAADAGMLFVFQQDGVNKFWMKAMTFSLDIIWMTSDGVIAYIQPNLSPATYPQAFGPDTPTRYVLEVNAGYAQENGVKVGDKVQL
jgi:uncharacterized membrane protein (UPF0127 family)